ncbi:hypothetical protein [Kocuria sp. NPDC057446]|uniref:hypothetical protein n=1 Tax=Kocuria sp. NPDC057446 TaxID=3346137 RepID=UPI0036A9F506
MSDEPFGGQEPDELDHRVVSALAGGGTPERIVAVLAGQPGVTALLRPGLVKTAPPLVELVVEQRAAQPGTRVEWAVHRVYDLAVHPDGRLELRGRHEP